MGQQQSQFRPDPKNELQVIGCGMSRTGTSSFTAALEILLQGPVYHGGQALFLREEPHLKRWIDIIRHTPIKTVQDKKIVKDSLKEQMKGYVACTDSPLIQFVEELVELYPNATVICTVRDPDDSWRSMEPLIRNLNMGFLNFVFWPLPTLRYFTTYLNAMDQGRFGELYYQERNTTCVQRTYDYHMEYLRRVVPEGKLHIVEVKDGWRPLCKALGKPIPDEPFPRINDAKATEDFFKGLVMRGLIAWAQIFAVAVVVLGVASYLWLHR